MFSLRDQVLSWFSYLGCNHHFSLPFGILTEGGHSVDFADDSKFLRFARFEKFGYPRESAGDVLGLGGFPRDLGQRVTRRNGLIFLNVDMGTDRQEVARFGGRRNATGLSARILDRDPRSFVQVFGVNDDFGGEAGALVHLLFHSDPFDNITIFYGPTELGKDGNRIGVPLR